MSTGWQQVSIATAYTPPKCMQSPCRGTCQGARSVVAREHTPRVPPMRQWHAETSTCNDSMALRGCDHNSQGKCEEVIETLEMCRRQGHTQRNEVNCPFGMARWMTSHTQRGFLPVGHEQALSPSDMLLSRKTNTAHRAGKEQKLPYRMMHDSMV